MLGVPIEFLIFAGMMVALAARAQRALLVVTVGVVALCVYKLSGPGFQEGPGVTGLLAHGRSEALALANLALLIAGFASLASHLEQSHLADRLSQALPFDGRGPLILLAIVFAMSAVIDNIAAALMGGVMARKAAGGPLATAYVVALVASANAGGAGSVLGDTTTTLMWVRGVPALDVLPAFIGAIVALLVFGVPAARAQYALGWGRRLSLSELPPLDWRKLAVVGLALGLVVAVTAVLNTLAPGMLKLGPWAGMAIWSVLLVSAALGDRSHLLSWAASRSALLLCLLVLAASLLPIEALPKPSVASVAMLGLVSSLVDNIPLTALALKQGGYDWGLVAYAVGLGGSLLWFGSSAGIALTEQEPHARPLRAWVGGTWPVAIGYGLGFAAMLLVTGWHPRAV